VRGSSSGEEAAAIALLVCGTLTTPVALFLGRHRRRPLRAYLLVVALGASNAANCWLYFRALGEGAIAPAVLSHYLAPILVAALAPRLLGEPRHPRTPLALLAALGGTALLLFTGPSSAASAAAVRTGLVFGGASAIFYAINVLLSKRLARDFSDLELTAFHTLAAGLLLLPLTGASGPYLHPVVGALISTLAAGLLYYAGLRRLPAERAGVLSYLEPVMAICVGWLVFSERPGLGALAGAALVLGGGLAVVMQPTDPPPAESDEAA
jgi:drug/metabolite transporter (DMT)-like permease